MSNLEVEQDGVKFRHGGKLRGVVGHVAVADGALRERSGPQFAQLPVSALEVGSVEEDCLSGIEGRMCWRNCWVYLISVEE